MSATTSGPRQRPLGVRHSQILAWVAAYSAAQRLCPTIAEVAKGCGVSSTYVVQILWDLRDAGRVTWIDRSPRTLRVVQGS